MSDFAQLLANGLVTGSILALAAIGVSLVYGILRIVNFAQGDYISYGAYAAVVVNITWAGSMVVATITAIAAIAALGVALEFGLWRPMRRRGAGLFTLFVTSLGLALVLRGVLYLVASPNPRTYRIDQYQVYDIHGVRLSESQVIAIALSFAAIFAVATLFARTRLGKQMRALSENPQLASVAGIDTDRIVVYTWALAGGLAGLAGVMQGLIQSSFDPNMGLALLLPVFAAVILGGIGSAYGALVGGLVLGIAMELSTWSELAGGISPTWKPVVSFVVLLVVLIARPTGLFGRTSAA
jgi:branched-subunit amino acid ABC-type transport system permease component